MPADPLRSLPRTKAAFVEPMECALVAKLPQGPDWTYEVKLDGYRAVAVRTSSEAILYSRNQKNFNKRYPRVAEALRDLPPETVIDGEVVALDEGMAELQRAVAINPSNIPARARIGVALLYQGKCEQALAIFQSNLWEANQTLRGYQIAWSLLCLGRTEEAFAAVEEYLKKYPADEGGLLSSTQALLCAATRKERLAEVQIRLAQKGRDFIHFHHTAYNIASAYALMHKDESAIQWLKTAAGEGFPCYPVFARDPNLANLRNDPRFAQFIADQKKQWESYKAAL